MNIKVIPFDESNSEHLKGFEYFSEYDGHPHYLIKGDAEDFDFGFRELIAEKFASKLPEDFLDEPNGCSHQLIYREKDHAKFRIDYEFISCEHDEDGESMVATFEFEGLLFVAARNDRTVVMAPLEDTIKLLVVEEA